jgi:hypothetical protein
MELGYGTCGSEGPHQNRAEVTLYASQPIRVMASDQSEGVGDLLRICLVVHSDKSHANLHIVGRPPLCAEGTPSQDV